MATWNDARLGHPPSDHRACLLSAMEQEYVWVDLIPPLPSKLGHVLPLARALLVEPEGWPKAVQLLSRLFWDPAQGVRGRDVRHLHCDERNWSLVPYVPPTLRDPTCRPWGARLFAALKADGEEWERYWEATRCRVCGGY